MRIEFNEWFDIFTDKVRSLGYEGRIDRNSAEEDYSYFQEDPETGAEEFVKEMNED